MTLAHSWVVQETEITQWEVTDEQNIENIG